MNRPSETTALRTCHICEAMCGLELSLDEHGAIRSARGDVDDVYSRGYVCPKGASIGQVDQDPDRLTGPLVRQDGQLRPASWASAFARVDEGLRAITERYGRDSVASYIGNPTGHNIASMLTPRLLKAIGSRQVFSVGTMDQMPQWVACGLLFGSPQATPVPDIDRTDLFIAIGANPVVSQGSIGGAPDYRRRLKAIRDRGGAVIVVDPARTATAELADLHIRLRPGTDPWLLLAVVRTLFQRGLVDLGSLGPRASGLDALEEAVEPFTPARAAYACGIEESMVLELTERLATADSAATYGRLGSTLNPFGTLTSWAVLLVSVLTGNLDRPGGMMFPTPALGSPTTRPKKRPGRALKFGRHHTRVRQLPEVLGELPVAALAEEITEPGEGRLHGLFIYAGNPARSAPNSAAIERALGELDLLVCIDPYLNETTRHADVILPPASPLTAPHIDHVLAQYAVHNVVKWSRPVRPVPADQRSEWDILLQLIGIAEGRGPSASLTELDDAGAEALAAGIATTLELDRSTVTSVEPLGPARLADLRLRAGPYGDHFGRRPEGLTLGRVADAPHGIDLGPLQPRIEEIIRTPSDTIELLPAAVATELQRLDATASTRGESGLQLIGRRDLRSKNSWLHNVPALNKGRPRHHLYLHPDDARRRGIEDGASVTVTSRTGSVEVPATITEEVLPGVCSLPHGWGHDGRDTAMTVANSRPGANSNLLTDDAILDPLSGTVGLNSVTVEVAASTSRVAVRP